MAAPSYARSPVVLIGRSNWDEWYIVIRASATAQGIWNLVNPDVTAEESVPLVRPQKPTVASINPEKNTLAELSTAERELYRIQLSDYQYESTRYDQEFRALNGFTARILESIAQQIIPYTYYCDTPKDILAKLKQQFAPTDKTREKEVLVRYQQLCEPPQSRNLEQWLSKWEVTYHEAVKLGLPNVQGTRAVDDFVLAIRNVDPAFYGYWTNHLENTNTYPTLNDIVDKFRKQLRKDVVVKGGQHGAFAASYQNRSLDSTRTDQQALSKCICGEQHRYSNCPYLVESIRPQKWKPDLAIERTIKQALERSEILREQVERARKWAATHRTTHVPEPAQESTQESDPVIPTGFATQVTRSGIYPLRDSFILDSGASTHVCNNPQRIYNLQPCKGDNQRLLTGSHQEVIEGFGSVDICVQTPNGQERTTTLYNVALVPTFHTNLVSFKRFQAIGGHWDTRTRCLTYNGQSFCKVLSKHDQFVLEYIPTTQRCILETPLDQPDAKPLPTAASSINLLDEPATDYTDSPTSTPTPIPTPTPDSTPTPDPTPTPPGLLTPSEDSTRSSTRTLQSGTQTLQATAGTPASRMSKVNATLSKDNILSTRTRNRKGGTPG